MRSPLDVIGIERIPSGHSISSILFVPVYHLRPAASGRMRHGAPSRSTLPRGDVLMTTVDSEAQRVRGYVLAQANKLTVPELVEKVRRDVLPLHAVAAAVPPQRFFERPGPEEWSAAEVFT